jgi:hypothetical protein
VLQWLLSTSINPLICSINVSVLQQDGLKYSTEGIRAVLIGSTAMFAFVRFNILSCSLHLTESEIRGVLEWLLSTSISLWTCSKTLCLAAGTWPQIS